MDKFSKSPGLSKDHPGLGAQGLGPRIPESTHYKVLIRVKRGQSPSFSSLTGRDKNILVSE